jgi:hypothetical protein
MFPSVLLNDKEGSIYNNVALAQKAFYTDCLQPVVNSVYQGISSGFGLDKMGEMIIADFSQIEPLQDDKKIVIETNKLNDELWSKRYQSNVCTLNEYLRAVGLPELANGNQYARDSDTIPLAVRLGVGGTQSLQLILSDPLLLAEQKINTLIILFGMKPEDAKSMVGDGSIAEQQVTEPLTTDQNEQ